MRPSRAALLVMLALSTTSCRLTTEPLGPDTLNGVWVHPFVLPGFSDVLVLEVHGGVVTGAGSWMGEAGPSGTSAVSGTASGDRVSLDITRTQRQPQPGTPRTDHFEGRIVSSSELAGILMQVDVGFEYTYVRSQAMN
jgi:hypothetical protein